MIMRLNVEIQNGAAELARLRKQGSLDGQTIARQQALLDEVRAEARFHQETLAESRQVMHRLQAELTQVRDELLTLRGSTSWRLTRSVRAVLSRHPRLAQLLRRTTKLLWWTATLQLRRRYLARRGRMLAFLGERTGVAATGPAPALPPCPARAGAPIPARPGRARPRRLRRASLPGRA